MSLINANVAAPIKRGRGRERPFGQLDRLCERDADGSDRPEQLARGRWAGGYGRPAHRSLSTTTMTTTPIETPTAEAVAEQPRLAAGVELIGEYKDSGFKDPPYLVRR